MCLEEFGPAKVFDQLTKVYKTEHLVLSRIPFAEIVGAYIVNIWALNSIFFC